MKNIKYQIICIALASITAFSWGCGDDFLDVTPADVIDFGDFWNSPQHAREGLNATYDALSSGGFMGGQIQLLSEIMADNLAENPVSLNGDLAAHYTRTTDIFLGTTRGLMTAGYYVPARANFLIDSIDLIPDIEPGERARMIAESKFLRGIAHFELVRMFAQPYGFTPDNSHLGLPIRLKYGIDTLSRSTVGEVYTQVLKDINEAIPDLNDGVSSGYATKDAALGYLAKIHFQMNDFEKAYDYANQVISNGRYAIDTSLTGRFSTQVTSEAVFYLASEFVDNAGGGFFFNYRVDPNSGLANAALTPGFASELLQNDDKRGTTWVQESDGFFWISGKVEDTARQNYTQVPLVHLTALKLIRAESAAELNTDLITAITDLNDIRERAGIPTLASTSEALTIIATARKERRKELIIEGDRLHELKRIAVLEEPNLKIRNAPWDCPGLVCQLPDVELQGNPNLKPNEEGGCN
ncbi:MAG: RagB/SusD family nutrient uptake outer membrane protein [Bacteroidia bacterium]